MKKALLAVSFGTSHLDTLEKNITTIETALQAAMPDRVLFRAFTSTIIMKKLRERDGIEIPDVAQALEILAEQGYDDLLIQPTHILNGDEYDKLCALAAPFTDRFTSVNMGTPLLTDSEDYLSLADALLLTLPEQRDGHAIVYMGHGSEHFANSAYALMEYVFRDKGRRDIHIGTVEGYPGLDEVMRRIKEREGVKTLTLMPLMIVAGDHAKNDLAGDEEDSWKTLLEAEGYHCECVLSGLGELAAVRDIFVQHALSAL